MPLVSLPLSDPGRPDLSSPLALLRWLGRAQRRGQLLATLWSTLELGAMAALPVAVGLGVQAVIDRDARALLTAGLLALLLSGVQTAMTVLLHRQVVWNWIHAAAQVRQLLARQASALGGGLNRRISTGEIVAVSSGDVEKIGWYVELTARLYGAVLAWLGVSAVVLWRQPALGLAVLLGVPVLAVVVWPLLAPFERRYTEQRALGGRASALAADTVAGLRVLRGIGGEELFLRRYRAASQRVRAAAVRTARSWAVLQAQEVLLPGLFVIGVTWYGARLVRDGSIGVGELIAVYGATAFLAAPLRVIGEAARAWGVARVSAERVVKVLSLTREGVGVAESVGNGASDSLEGKVVAGAEGSGGSADSAELVRRAARSDLHDPVSGLTARAGRLTAVVCGDPDLAGELAARLGGRPALAEDERPKPSVRLGGVELDGVLLADARAAVLVHDKEPVLLSGTLADLLDVPRSGRVDPAAALAAARAQDALDALVDGSPECAGDPMAARITERGRSLSGGQRQRLALARSLVADPPVLVLDEPTSAVDAHTESRIAAGLRELRAGRTTVVFATSPLLLDQADTVLLLRQGRVAATGTHRELMAGDPRYRTVVTRDENAPGEPSAAVGGVPAAATAAVVASAAVSGGEAEGGAGPAGGGG
ncbi:MULTISPECIES: ABC transporter ATP-binding protein [Kitasatospora]|uniref:Putative multidrug ABC transporter ATP-binding and permease protein n=1 Tax=Kitasatospora setae (strain ATCC 33774 / DSM 43861 / JCM 3304 / KCC A-0304 / NBRC 14216 / KM-6054) TaxID=452652 RepID=E4N8P1_KITSK|nr:MULTISPECIES: ABC transporter ATP-binding protein [Kitasatospora]BAJ27572.1 putative multidrug ABC transporter ATP-binding and permease protein [Kitasatospora setae KM-6054]